MEAPPLPPHVAPRVPLHRPRERVLGADVPVITPSRGRVAIALGVILILFTARCAQIAARDSITSDEATHLVHCLHFWMTGDDLGMWKLGAPRLPHSIYSLASYAALRPAGLLPKGEGEILVGRLNELVLAGADRVLVPARLVAILSGLALIVTVYWAVARRHGAWPGLVAAALLSMVPEVVAHSAIAGSDMPFTAAAFLALVLAARYLERPTPGRWIGLALGIGLAWAMRHTALVLLLLAGAVHLLQNWRRTRPATLLAGFECVIGSVWATAGLGMIAFVVLWAGDGFGLVTIGEVGQKVTMVKVPQKVGAVGLSSIPVPSSALSILKQIRHQNQGHEAYFLGEYRTTGWALYFPIAFLLKTPLGLLALFVLAAARVRRRDAWDSVALAFLAILWLMLVRNKVNIGLRYAMLTYPIALAFAARMFARPLWSDRVWTPAVVVATVAFVAASIAAGPRCLSHFNALAGGADEGWVYLADSNIDWGQDFDRLAHAVNRLGIKEVTTDLHSERRLALPNVYSVVYPARSLQVPDETPPNRRLYDAEADYLPVYTRYMAVSVSRLLGLYSQNDLSWLKTRKVVEKVGESIFIFDLDTPADRPFFQ